MKFSSTTVIVLAISGQAFAFGRHGERDVTNGEAFSPVPRSEEIQPFGPFGPRSFGPPFAVGPGKGVTKVEPIVAIYTDAGSQTTQTGVVIEIGPARSSHGRVTTKTIWPGPQAAEAWGWNAGVHTKTITISGPAPTSPRDPWSDWPGPSQPTTGPTSTMKSTSSASPRSTSSSASSHSTSTTSGRNGVGPLGGSTSLTSSTVTTSSNTISSSSTTSLPSTFSTSFTSSSTSISASSTSVSATSSSRIPDSPIGGTTSSSSSPSSESSTSSTATSISSSLATSSANPTNSSTSDSSLSSSSSLTSTSSTSTTTSSTTSSAPSVAVTNDVSSLSYIDGILQAHNIHRANHTAQNLTWSENLASIATDIAATCNYEHNTTAGGGGYGQNIGAGYTPQRVPAMIGNSMYNTEMPFYPLLYGRDNPDMSQFDSWGHFSQIVWKDTKGVGCATQQCTKLENADGVAPYFTVCNYSPPGNIQGAYSQVGAPLGQPIVVIAPS